MFEITRRALSIGGFQLHWYGVLIALGVLGAVVQACMREKRLGLEKDSALNLALVCVPAGIICARIYYVIFSWDYYAAHPEEILNLRSGGIAVYGAIIGGALAVWIYCRIKKIRFAAVADLVAPGLALGQAIGRWGNFLNGEAYGEVVANPALQFFPMSVYIEGSGWHWATFFYESMWCALICAVLLIGEKRKFFKKRGDMFLSYIFLYALERSVVEGLRSDSLYTGPFRVSQLLSIAVLLAVLFLLMRKMRGERIIWRRIRLAALALLFILSLTASTLSALVWALLVLLNMIVEYKSLPRTNDEM